jgi:hypothetical protein
MLGITDDEIHKITRKRKKKGISFNDDEEIINPEDVDPSVGRFRNLIQTTVVPSKVYIYIINLLIFIYVIQHLHIFIIHLYILLTENENGRWINIIVGRNK